MNYSTIFMVLAILIFVVFPSFKDRTMPVKKLLLSPAIFLYLFYLSIKQDFHLTTISYSFIIISSIAGIIAGYWLRHTTSITADKQNKKIHIPGGYINLISFCLIFAVHFVIGYTKAVAPGLLSSNLLTSQLFILALTLVSCLTIGTNGCLFIKYLRSKSAPLTFV